MRTTVTEVILSTLTAVTQTVCVCVSAQALSTRLLDVFQSKNCEMSALLVLVWTRWRTFSINTCV